MKQRRPSKSNKKGAIELGMNTIIIVVIGITLLSLALVWIRNMMGESGIGGLTQGAFGQAETAISDIYKGTSEELTLSPETMNVKQGSTGKATMAFANLEQSDVSGVNFKITSAADSGQKVKCVFASNLKDTIGPYEVPSGKQKELDVLIQVATDSKLGTAVCTVTAPGTVDAEKTVLITIGA